MINFLHLFPNFKVSHNFKYIFKVSRVQYWRFFLEIVFKVDHKKTLKTNIITKIAKFPSITGSKLNEHVTAVETVRRDLMYWRAEETRNINVRLSYSI